MPATTYLEDSKRTRGLPLNQLDEDMKKILSKVRTKYPDDDWLAIPHILTIEKHPLNFFGKDKQVIVYEVMKYIQGPEYQVFNLPSTQEVDTYTSKEIVLAYFLGMLAK